MNYVACSRPPRYDLEKPQAPKADVQEFLLAGSIGVAKSWEGVTPDSPAFLNIPEAVKKWRIEMNKIVVKNNKLVLEFQDQDKLMKFIELLKLLGVTQDVEKREIKIRYDESFKLYLERDRGLHEHIVRDYLNYLKKLNGKTINYGLYLEISHSKWLVKTVRLFLDYIYKCGEISWEELQKLKST